MRLVAVLLVAAVLIPSSLGISPNDVPLIKPSTIDVDAKSVGRSLLANGDYRMASSNANMKPLKGTALSDPACCTAGVHLTYCFVRWSTGFVFYRRVGTGGKWASMGRWIVGAPSCIAHGSDVTVIVVQGINGARPPVISNTIRNGKLLGWKLTGGYNAREAPGCVTNGAVVSCLYRGTKCGAYLLTMIGGVWKSVRYVGGEQYGPIGGIYLPSTKETDFYAVNTAYHLQYLQILGGIKPWRQAGNFVMTGRPSVCSKAPKTIDIFTIGPGANLLWCQRDALGRYRWTNLGGPILYPPTCVGRLNNVNCFGINMKYEFVRKIYIGGKWGAWTVVAGGYIGTPACHPSISGVNIISCYVRNLKHGIDAYAFIA